jgi:hypothetical protein
MIRRAYDMVDRVAQSVEQRTFDPFRDYRFPPLQIAETQPRFSVCMAACMSEST